jgi:hypothetical protein
VGPLSMESVMFNALLEHGVERDTPKTGLVVAYLISVLMKAL